MEPQTDPHPSPENSSQPIQQAQQSDNDRVEIMNDQIPTGSNIFGHEEILYATPQEIQVHMNFHVIEFMFLSLGIEMAFKVVLGLLLILAYKSIPLAMKPVIIAFMVYQIIRIIIDIYYWIKFGQVTPANVQTYKQDIVLSFSFFFLFLGVYLALDGKISPVSLPYFAYAHILLCLIRLCLGVENSAQYLPGVIFSFFESFQLLIIAYKISQNGADVNWTWFLLFYYFFAIIFLIISSISFLLFVFFMIIVIFSDALRELPSVNTWVIGTILFYFIWVGLVYYLLLSGFDVLLVGNQLGFETAKGVPDTRIYVTGWIMMVCALLTLFLLIFVFKAVKTAFLANLSKNRSKEITLKTFAKNMILDITKVSGNYFKPKDKNDENKDASVKPILEADEGLCITCMSSPSDIMIMPCGHGGMCQACIKIYLKDKEECFMCRVKMEEIYLIAEDLDKQTFVAKGYIKLKR